MMQRRTLLQAAVMGLGLGAGTRLWAADGELPRLLVVLLRGAYDSSSLLVPCASEFYYQARPTLAMPRPGTSPDACVALDEQWALAPAVVESLMPLWKDRQLAFVPFAGGEDTSRSHFQSQDVFEKGLAQEQGRIRSGFLNRLAGELGARSIPGREALAFTEVPPLIFQGDVRVGNQGLRRLGKPGVEPQQSEQIRRMYAGTELAGAVEDGFATRGQVLREMQPAMGAEMDKAGRQAIDTKGFELEARRIGRLMRDQVALGFVDVGGWDTHAAQGGAQGILATRLAALSRGLAGFADELGARTWERTVVVVASEFGRTFRENGNHGTDHGHGTTYWVLGGGLKGGRVVGRQQALRADTLFQNRDLPVLNDYRSVLGGLLARHYALSKDALQRVFPGAEPVDLGLL